jgi:hypothetical protein
MTRPDTDFTPAELERAAALASRDTTLKVWELETGRELHTLAGHKLRGLGRPWP